MAHVAGRFAQAELVIHDQGTAAVGAEHDAIRAARTTVAEEYFGLGQDVHRAIEPAANGGGGEECAHAFFECGGAAAIDFSGRDFGGDGCREVVCGADVAQQVVHEHAVVALGVVEGAAGEAEVHAFVGADGGEMVHDGGVVERKSVGCGGGRGAVDPRAPLEAAAFVADLTACAGGLHFGRTERFAKQLTELRRFFFVRLALVVLPRLLEGDEDD